MIHDDPHTVQQKSDSYTLNTFYDEQGPNDVYYERDLQLPDDNNSLYSGINIGPFPSHNEAVDLNAINSSDLLPIHTNESALSALIETSTLKVTENNTQMEQISNVFPNLEEHNLAGYEFELNLNPNISGKSNWQYSSKLQKVFIKLDQTFYIDAIYSPKNLYDPLYLRAMMVFVDDISSPVQRCYNHMNSDHSSEINLRYYILRSENSNVKYEGKYEGKNVSDRLSVVIPLSQVRQSNENNLIKHSIALKFVCQNSCIGRKQTAVIFTLEDQLCHVLGKRVVNVKVCSCPKRDKQKDEAKYAMKRSSNDTKGCPPNKIPAIVKIKEEPVASTSLPITSPQQQVTSSSNIKNEDFQEIKFEITIPEHLSCETARSVFNIIAGAMAMDAKNTEKYRKCLKEAKQKVDEFYALHAQKSKCQQGSCCLRK